MIGLSISLGSIILNRASSDLSVIAPVLAVEIDQSTITAGDELGADVTATASLAFVGVPPITLEDVSVGWIVNGVEALAGDTVAEGDIVRAIAQSDTAAGLVQAFSDPLTVEGAGTAPAAPADGDWSVADADLNGRARVLYATLGAGRTLEYRYGAPNWAAMEFDGGNSRWLTLAAYPIAPAGGSVTGGLLYIREREAGLAPGSESSGKSVGTIIGRPLAIASLAELSATDGVAITSYATAQAFQSAETLSYSATGLPTGLSINSGTGAITGTPSVAGAGTATITATNTSGIATRSLAYNVSAGAGDAPATDDWDLQNAGTGDGLTLIVTGAGASDLVEYNVNSGGWVSAFTGNGATVIDGLATGERSVVIRFDGGTASAAKLATVAAAATLTEGANIYPHTVGAGRSATIRVDDAFGGSPTGFTIIGPNPDSATLVDPEAGVASSLPQDYTGRRFLSVTPTAGVIRMVIRASKTGETRDFPLVLTASHEACVSTSVTRTHAAHVRKWNNSNGSAARGNLSIAGERSWNVSRNSSANVSNILFSTRLDGLVHGATYTLSADYDRGTVPDGEQIFTRIGLATIKNVGSVDVNDVSEAMTATGSLSHTFRASSMDPWLFIWATGTVGTWTLSNLTIAPASGDEKPASGVRVEETSTTVRRLFGLEPGRRYTLSVTSASATDVTVGTESDGSADVFTYTSAPSSETIVATSGVMFVHSDATITGCTCVAQAEPFDTLAAPASGAMDSHLTVFTGQVEGDADFILDANEGGGEDHTTFADALAACSGGEIVAVRPGEYTVAPGAVKLSAPVRFVATELGGPVADSQINLNGVHNLFFEGWRFSSPVQVGGESIEIGLKHNRFYGAGKVSQNFGSAVYRLNVEDCEFWGYMTDPGSDRDNLITNLLTNAAITQMGHVRSRLAGNLIVGSRADLIKGASGERDVVYHNWGIDTWPAPESTLGARDNDHSDAWQPEGQGRWAIRDVVFSYNLFVDDMGDKTGGGSLQLLWGGGFNAAHLRTTVQGNLLCSAPVVWGLGLSDMQEGVQRDNTLLTTRTAKVVLNAEYLGELSGSTFDNVFTDYSGFRHQANFYPNNTMLGEGRTVIEAAYERSTDPWGLAVKSDGPLDGVSRGATTVQALLADEAAETASAPDKHALVIEPGSSPGEIDITMRWGAPRTAGRLVRYEASIDSAAAVTITGLDGHPNSITGTLTGVTAGVRSVRVRAVTNVLVGGSWTPTAGAWSVAQNVTVSSSIPDSPTLGTWEYVDAASSGTSYDGSLNVTGATAGKQMVFAIHTLRDGNNTDEPTLTVEGVSATRIASVGITNSINSRSHLALFLVTLPGSDPGAAINFTVTHSVSRDRWSVAAAAVTSAGTVAARTAQSSGATGTATRSVSIDWSAGDLLLAAASGISFASSVWTGATEINEHVIGSSSHMSTAAEAKTSSATGGSVSVTMSPAADSNDRILLAAAPLYIV